MKIPLKELIANINTFIEKACIGGGASGKLLCRQCGAEIQYQQKTLPMEFPSMKESDKTGQMTFTVSRIPYCPHCIPASDSFPPFQYLEAVIVGK